MKKRGIINAKLMEEITALGHYDSFVICDMAFPIPRNAVKVDLALVEGVPTFLQVLHSVLKEVIVEKVILADNIQQYNPGLDEDIRGIMTKQPIEYVDFAEFRELCKNAKFIIRSGSSEPCSNMIMVSAAGVPSMAAACDIDV